MPPAGPSRCRSTSRAPDARRGPDLRRGLRDARRSSPCVIERTSLAAGVIRRADAGARTSASLRRTARLSLTHSQPRHQNCHLARADCHRHTAPPHCRFGEPVGVTPLLSAVLAQASDVRASRSLGPSNGGLVCSRAIDQHEPALGTVLCLLAPKAPTRRAPISRPPPVPRRDPKPVAPLPATATAARARAHAARSRARDGGRARSRGRCRPRRRRSRH